MGNPTFSKVVLGVAVFALMMAVFLGYAQHAAADTIVWCRSCN